MARWGEGITQALQIGDPAPDFELLNDEGAPMRLSQFRDHKVVLYFYPKDDTPGCTAEACAFRDDYDQFQQMDAVILGMSPDSSESHRKFKAVHGLPFPLLSDIDHKVAEAYGVWVEKSMYGKTYWGNQRASFLIDEQGHIAKIYPKVKPEGHSRELLTELAATRTGAAP